LERAAHFRHEVIKTDPPFVFAIIFVVH
jgi:hypothetical protein